MPRHEAGFMSIITRFELVKRVLPAHEQRAKFRNLKEFKNGQDWLHEEAIKLADEFDAISDINTFIAFWTRENVAKTIEDADMQLMCHWLRVEIWKLTRED